MTDQSCQNCLHWNLKDSALRGSGFGLCRAEPNHALAKGRTYPGRNLCRIGKFVPASDVTVQRREMESSK